MPILPHIVRLFRHSNSIVSAYSRGFLLRTVQTVGHADIFQDPQGNWQVATAFPLLISDSLYWLGGLSLCRRDREHNTLTILWDGKLC